MQFLTLDLALYEATNVTELLWKDPAAASRLQARIWTLDAAQRMVRVDEPLLADAGALVRRHGISAYDAAAERLGMTLVSCDIRDLVSKGLAMTPTDYLAQLERET